METADPPLFHITRPPKKSLDKSPLLIMLHGYGSNEEDLFSFAGELQDEFFIISVRAPYNLMPFGHAWYAIHFDAKDGKWSDDQQAIASRDRIANFIDEAVATYPVDPDNVTLLGFSQGTILSYAVALSYPKKVKNVIGLSGYINQDIIAVPLEGNCNNLDFYCSHGTVDQVIPVAWARESMSFLKDEGIRHIYEEYPVGHGVAPQNFHAFKKWLGNKI